jgi:hypothetical protein
MAVEGSMIGHHFSGDIWSNGNIYLSTGATSYISTDGNINGTAYGGFLTTYIENRAAAYANDRAQSWAYVQNALAACGAGNIGSYVFARTPSEIGPGSGIAGTSLHWSSNTAISPGLINAGSWRCMGYAFGSQATLFLRYA